MQYFPALLVFERCNELPISHRKEQHLFNHHT